MDKTVRDKIIRIMELVQIKDGVPVFTDESRKLIHEVAENCRNQEMVKRHANEADNYSAGLTAEDVYLDMLNKIIHAPTALHKVMVPRFLIPVIDDMLEGGKCHNGEQ